MTDTGQTWAIASLEFIFFHKEQTSWCVTAERLTRAVFRTDIFNRKSWITSVLFLLSLLPQAHLQLISLSFLSDLALLMSTWDVAWDGFSLDFVDGTSAWVAPLFGAAADIGLLLFPQGSPPFPHVLPMAEHWEGLCLQPTRHWTLDPSWQTLWPQDICASLRIPHRQ